MPKAKLKIVKSDFKKLSVAASFNDITLKPEESKAVGNTVFVAVSYRSANQLFETGRLMESVTGDELDAIEDETGTEAKGTKGKKK